MKRIFIFCASALLVGVNLAQGQSLSVSNFSAGNADLDAAGRNPALDFIFQQYRANKPTANGFKVKGSQYFDENFQKAVVYSQDGAEGDVFIRYDGYSDEVQLKKFKAQEEIQALLKRKDIYCVSQGVPIMFKGYTKKNGKIGEGYLFQVVETKDFSFYERRIKHYKEGKKAKTSLELDVPNRFVTIKEFYLGKKEGEQERIFFLKRSKKEILGQLNSFPNYERVKNYISEKRLNLKKDEDIMRLFLFYKTL